ncbi:MAG: hypothetical protein BGP03_02420 [Pseudonocardia sp. 73-21]|nr:MAG: hypothetical protein BGP03_02420 [Pseudonocardia sp. 73-21]
MPDPAMSSRSPGSAATASISRSSPFWRTSMRPRKRIGPAEPPGSSAGMSTPLGTTVTRARGLAARTRAASTSLRTTTSR